MAMTDDVRSMKQSTKMANSIIHGRLPRCKRKQATNPRHEQLGRYEHAKGKRSKRQLHTSSRIEELWSRFSISPKNQR